jgi:hypothetical protein
MSKMPDLAKFNPDTQDKAAQGGSPRGCFSMDTDLELSTLKLLSVAWVATFSTNYKHKTLLSSDHF